MRLPISHIATWMKSWIQRSSAIDVDMAVTTA